MATLGPLRERKFQIEFHSHAEAILTHDFPERLTELWNVLDEVTLWHFDAAGRRPQHQKMG